MRVVVDRLEGAVVIVTDGMRSFELPLALFEGSLRESDVVELTAVIDGEASARARAATAAKRAALGSDDDGGDFSL